MELPNLSKWVQHLKHPLVLIGFVIMLFVLFLNNILEKSIKEFSQESSLNIIYIGLWIISGLGFLIIVFGFLLAFRQGNKTTESSNLKSSSLEPSSFAHGIKVNKIIWKHHYFDDGNFKGEIEYFIENATRLAITDLLPERACWFGANITPKFQSNIYGDDSNFYSLENQYFNIHETESRLYDGSNKQVTSLNWQLKVNPPLDAQKSLHYGTIIDTEHTEKEAFTSEGTLGGMTTSFLADNIVSEFYAPEGYYFINKGYIIRDRAGKTVRVNNDEPVFESNTKIVWNIKKPIPTLQYLLRIVIVKRN